VLSRPGKPPQNPIPLLTQDRFFLCAIPLRPQEGIHGTARFLTEPEIRQLGLLPAKEGGRLDGVYIGGFVNRRGALE